MELTKENFEDFIKRLKHDNTEGNRSTANPLFVVQKKNQIGGMDSGYSDKSEFYNNDEQATFADVESIVESLDDPKDLLGKSEANSIDGFLELSDAEQEDAVEALGYEKVYYKDIWEDVDVHFTEQAAEEFIRRKKHDYDELRIYVKSQYWCWEFNMIVQGFLSGKISLVEPSPPLKQSEFIAWVESEENLEYPDGLKICIGGEYLHKNGQNGFCYTFDFELNNVGMFMGGGFHWEGTGQEFAEQWTKKETDEDH